MPNDPLMRAIDAIPAGAWAVAVSGGADSVALLALVRARADLALHVVHLNHETRGAESDADAGFVADLCRRWGVPCTIARRSEIEPRIAHAPNNPSARFRQIRFELFRQTVRHHSLAGVILAHHADDQAETVLQRLLRSSGPMGLAGMSPRARVGALLLLRPLLGVRREDLRAHLRNIHQEWREDASNVLGAYQRNRVRKLLAKKPSLRRPLIDLGHACAVLRRWVRANAPRLEARFPAARLADLPHLLARESARRWLADRGAPPGRIEPAAIERLIHMSRDAASPPRQHFPGRILVRRRRGQIDVEGS